MSTRLDENGATRTRRFGVFNDRVICLLYRVGHYPNFPCSGSLSDGTRLCCVYSLRLMVALVVVAEPLA